MDEFGERLHSVVRSYVVVALSPYIQHNYANTVLYISYFFHQVFYSMTTMILLYGTNSLPLNLHPTLRNILCLWGRRLLTEGLLGRELKSPACALLCSAEEYRKEILYIMQRLNV